MVVLMLFGGIRSRWSSPTSRSASPTGSGSSRSSTPARSGWRAGAPGTSAPSACGWSNIRRVRGGPLVPQGADPVLRLRRARDRAGRWPPVSSRSGHELPGGGQRGAPRSRTATGATLFIVDQWAHLPSSMRPTLLTADEILATRAVIDAAFLDSPLMHHPALDEALGCAVMLKVETLNPIRSFKARGTEAVLAALAPRPGAVVAASTGNFGQGIAWSARRRGIAATIYAPDGANPQKVEAMRRLGAVVHLVEPGRDESDAARE